MKDFGMAPIKAEGSSVHLDSEAGTVDPDPGYWVEFRYHEDAPMDLTGLNELKKVLKDIPEELRDSTIESFVAICHSVDWSY